MNFFQFTFHSTVSFLLIFRSFSLTSLAFFRNLIKINAENATSTQRGNEETDEYRKPYGLEIYENDNLQTLFNWKEKQYLEIIGGGMFIHYNSKLCMDEVHSLQNITIYDRAHDSLSYSTNGYDETCHAIGVCSACNFLLNGFEFIARFFVGLHAFHMIKSHSDVEIYWNIRDFGADRRLIGYFVYYIEAPSQNITYFTGLDACST